MSKTYDEMTDAELKEAAREIIRTSQSEDEARQRLATELSYPHEVVITSHLPTDDAGKIAREITVKLGAPTLANGAMVMTMLQGHDGFVII